jgi:hypothetical protein
MPVRLREGTLQKLCAVGFAPAAWGFEKVCEGKSSTQVYTLTGLLRSISGFFFILALEKQGLSYQWPVTASG